jgi:hypothetical protein
MGADIIELERSEFYKINIFISIDFVRNSVVLIISAILVKIPE